MRAELFPFQRKAVADLRNKVAAALNVGKMRPLVDLVAKILVRALNGHTICSSNEYKKQEVRLFTLNY